MHQAAAPICKCISPPWLLQSIPNVDRRFVGFNQALDEGFYDIMSSQLGHNDRLRARLGLSHSGCDARAYICTRNSNSLDVAFFILPSGRHELPPDDELAEIIVYHRKRYRARRSIVQDVPGKVANN